MPRRVRKGLVIGPKRVRAPAGARKRKNGSGALSGLMLDLGLLKMSFLFRAPVGPYPNPFPNPAGQS